MKKLIFALIAALSVTLTSCSYFGAKPLNPKIIGTATLQYSAQDGQYFAVIDSVKYTLTPADVLTNNPHSLSALYEIIPVEGMLITVFKADGFNGFKAVIDRQNEVQIEEMYRQNNLLALFFFIPLCIFIVAYAVKVAYTYRKNEKAWQQIKKTDK